MSSLDVTAGVQGGPKKPKPFKTEMEKHEGWIENLRNEKRTMKDSIKNCISGGYTKDASRAEKILQFQFPESENGSEPAQSRNGSRIGHSLNSYNRMKSIQRRNAANISKTTPISPKNAQVNVWQPNGPKGERELAKQNEKRQEVLMEKQMVNFGSAKQPLPIEFLVKREGKKFMEGKKIRALQSKISLKFPLAANEKEKVRMKPSVKQSIIDDFDKAYILNCDQDKQRKRMRMVSNDSQFDPKNKPPKEYLENDSSYLEKPGKINLNSVNAPVLPLAGRLTEIGEQILLIGSQKAKFICTGQWDFKYTQGSKPSSKQSTFRKPSLAKVTDFDAFDYVEPQRVRSNIQMAKPSQNTELQRLGRAMKNGRITPLDGKYRSETQDKFTKNTFDNKKSVFDTADKMYKIDTSRYEVSYSPERQTLIDTLKQKRRMKMTERNANSMHGSFSNRMQPRTTKNVSQSQNHGF